MPHVMHGKPVIAWKTHLGHGNPTVNQTDARASDTSETLNQINS
jgi:hypothetical protein